MGIVQDLLKQHRLVSDQVDPDEMQVLLTELRKVIAADPGANVVEFGCYVGTASLMIRRLMDTTNAEGELYVYDSFAGLPEKNPEDESSIGIDFQPGALRVNKRELLMNFKKADLDPPDKVIKAWFSDLSTDQLPDRIGFAFLDGDFYESILDPLKLIGPRLTPTATIVVDDYTNQALPGAQKAVDHWLANDPIGQAYKLTRAQASLAILNRTS